MRYIKSLIFWELEISEIEEKEVYEILFSQKKQANILFADFIEKNYEELLLDNEFLSSINLFKNKIIPEINSDLPTLMILVDNLRYDQWKSIEPYILEGYQIQIQI